jgi:hypothetical protein
MLSTDGVSIVTIDSYFALPSLIPVRIFKYKAAFQLAFFLQKKREGKNPADTFFPNKVK